MAQSNKNLSDIFSDMASIYRYMGGSERFRALAYQKAARVIAGLPEDVSTLLKQQNLEDLPGIGESIADKIKEYIDTGKIKKYEELKKQVPHEIMELMDVKGMGPESLRKIHTELKIDTRDEFIKALQDGRISKMKGFGQKKVENMLRGLKLHKTVEERMLLWDALEMGEKVLAWIRQLPEVKESEIAGSLRRKKETIGDVDILVTSSEKAKSKIVNHFTSPKIAKEVLLKGDTKASIIMKGYDHQVDLRIVAEDEWGAALQYFTGSKEHNIHLRTIAKEKGYKISEYGVFSIKTNKRIASKTEEDVYNTFDFQIMPPEMREDKGEIELSIAHKIPKLVSLEDIKSDMHMHSTWTDGTNTIEEIAGYIKKNFRYEFIVITDHSKSTRIAHGLDEKSILKYIKEIKKLNEKLGSDFIKTGLEVDILPDGKLDISDEVLSQLDWVNAAIHANFNKDNTERIIRACENANVCSIAHPTGRLIGSREPYEIKMDEVIKTAKRTNTFLEINSQPLRMDLNDDMARSARENGVKLVINTDTHGLPQFNYMKLGIFIAKRAWCTKDDIVNTRSWNEIKKLIDKKKIKKRLATSE